MSVVRFKRSALGRCHELKPDHNFKPSRLSPARALFFVALMSWVFALSACDRAPSPARWPLAERPPSAAPFGAADEALPRIFVKPGVALWQREASAKPIEITVSAASDALIKALSADGPVTQLALFIDPATPFEQVAAVIGAAGQAQAEAVVFALKGSDGLGRWRYALPRMCAARAPAPPSSQQGSQFCETCEALLGHDDRVCVMVAAYATEAAGWVIHGIPSDDRSAACTSALAQDDGAASSEATGRCLSAPYSALEQLNALESQWGLCPDAMMIAGGAQPWSQVFARAVTLEGVLGLSRVKLGLTRAPAPPCAPTP